MKLKEFVEKFVSHNDVVYLYNKQKVLDPTEGKDSFTWKWDLLWYGMDWQISFAPDDEEYFKVHPDIEKCPYRDNEVISICPPIDGFGGCTDEVGIVIESSSERRYVMTSEELKLEEEICPICGYPLYPNEKDCGCQCYYAGSAHPDRSKRERVVYDHLYLLTSDQLKHIIDLQKKKQISYEDEEKNKIVVELKKDKDIEVEHVQNN